MVALQHILLRGKTAQLTYSFKSRRLLKMKTVDTITVAKRLDNGEQLHLIDVREVDEVETGKIPGAVNIPLGLLEFRDNELDKSHEYIMVCRSGGRSGKATKYLESKGFKVMNMAGGMLDWKGPVE